MKILRFKGKDMQEALRMVKATLGDDAIILETLTRRGEEGQGFVELVAAVDTMAEEAANPEKRQVAPPSVHRNRPDKVLGRRPPSLLGFVGLSGCGKTTSLLKLAIGFCNQGREVAIVNADQKKIGAMEALERASRILGCDFFDVKYPMELLKVVSGLGRDVCVLVDFAGLNLFKGHGLDQLKPFFLAVPGLRAVSVVQANLHPRELKEIHRRISSFALWATVVTKVDELLDASRLHEVLAGCPSPIVYLSKGENISCGLEEYYVPHRDPGSRDGKNGSWECDDKELASGLYT